jgi:trimethylamine:corrinoid methyltransferase-like protein
MAGKIQSVTNSRLSLNILSPQDVQRIHTATLDVIESVGVRFPSARALDVWAAHGAAVDRETMIVRAPGALIEEALKKAPPVYTLAARDPAQDLPLDGNHVYVGTDGCGVEVLDPFTGQRRRSCLQDVGDIARVADALKEVAFHWVAVAACTNWQRSGTTLPSTYRRKASITSARRAPLSRWRRPSPAGATRCASDPSSRLCSAPPRRWARTAAVWRRR